MTDKIDFFERHPANAAISNPDLENNSMSTKVVLIRHEAPRPGEEKPMPNILNEEAQDRAFRTGEAFRNLGIVVDLAVSSPQFRAIETLQYFLAGNSGGKGPIVLSGVDVAFGDMLLGRHPYSDAEKQVVMAAAAAAKQSPEEFLMTSPDFEDKQRARGIEGAIALVELVKYNKDGIAIGICSHGGSRLESVIQVLTERMSPRPSVAMMEPGEVAILTFGDNDGPEVVSYEYLGHPGDALASTPPPLELGG